MSGQRPIEDRFWEKVSKAPHPKGCWEWTAYRSNGYGWIGVDGVCVPAHRVAYQLQVGPIPDGLQIDHLCRNRACQRGDHLEAVTRKENILRGVGASAMNAKKTHCPQGHAYVSENIYTNKAKGSRMCLTCMTMRNNGIDPRLVTA